MKGKEIFKTFISCILIIAAYYLTELITINWFNTTNFWIKMLVLFVIYISFEVIKYIIVLKIREKKKKNEKSKEE